MKIIFLDIDGVLNDDTTPPYPKDWPEGHLKEDLIARINQIVEATGAKIVMSTAWRTVLSLKEFQELLGSKGLRAEIIDCTPSRMSFRPRWHEIKEWILDNREIYVESWVAIDDLLIKEAGERLVRTNPSIGITDEDVEKAIKILLQ